MDQKGANRLRGAMVVAAMLAVAASVDAGAATFYVDGSTTGCGGSPCSNTNAGTAEATAFASPQGCINRMNGGDTCLIKNGTYYQSGLGRYAGFDFSGRCGRCTGNATRACLYDSQCSGAGVCRTRPNGSLNGTATAYTTVKAYPGHRPKLCVDASCSPAPSTPTIGVHWDGIGTAPAYISFQGLEVSGALTVWSAWGTNPANGVHHIEVANNDLHGGYTEACDGNYTPLRLEVARNLSIHHNHIHGIDGGCTGDSSAAGIKVYVNRETVIEYNTIDASRRIFGIDDKDDSYRNIHRFNRISNATYFGIRLNQQTCRFNGCVPPTGTQIYGNLITGSNGIQALMDLDGASIHQNTIHGADTGIELFFNHGAGPKRPTKNWSIRDNLIQGTVELNLSWDENSWPPQGTNVVDYNVYAPGAMWMSNRFCGLSATCGPSEGPSGTEHRELTPNGWRERLQANAGCAGCEAHSRKLQCQFADTATFKLAADSPCRTASSTGGEVGAYGAVDCVGHGCSTGGQPPSGVPPDPTGLRRADTR